MNATSTAAFSRSTMATAVRAARTRLILSMVILGGTAALAAAQDADDCKDHPMFSRMPNFEISSCEDQEFSAAEFEQPDGEEKTVEGRYWKIDFHVKEGVRAPGPLQIGRNYWNTMAPRGGTRLVENLDPGGGTMVARMPGPNGGGMVWLRIDVANNGEMYSLTALQEAGMRQDVALTASELATELARSGAVTLQNILFDTGNATLKAESEAALTAVVGLMKEDPALQLEVQGHTDNVGAKPANLKLSQDRAASVKAYLVKAGIATTRLTTAGFGDAQPVAPNTTDEGRAKNRRVVLKKR